MKENEIIKDARNSSVELLRMICIIGISVMHAWGGQNVKTVTGINLVFGIFINTVCNMGVSIFMLISGYYGMNHSLRKTINLELEVIFYSLLGMLITSIARNRWSIITVCRAFVPVVTKKYWFITIYMFMMIFGRYIDKIWQKLERKEFAKLILMMFVAFSFLPSFTTVHMMEDGGKGLMNMLLMYFIGRYVRLYGGNWKFRDNRLITVTVVLTVLWTGLNIFISFGLHDGIGLYSFATGDSSVYTVIAGTCIFILTIRKVWHSERVNRIAGHILAVYLFEGSLRIAFNSVIKWEYFVSCWNIPMVIMIYCLFVVSLCVIIDSIRGKLLRNMEDKVSIWLENRIQYLLQKADTML